MSAATVTGMVLENARVEAKVKRVRDQKADMIACVKDMPADGVTRIIPGHGMRGVHMPATSMHCECAYAEISETSALRSRFVRGKWMPREEVSYNSDEWGPVQLGSAWSL